MSEGQGGGRPRPRWEGQEAVDGVDKVEDALGLTKWEDELVGQPLPPPQLQLWL